MTVSSDASGDTIVAQSTPPGYSGVAVIRITGPDSRRILQRVFQPSRPDASFTDRRMVYGRFIDPDSREIVDDGLAVFMEGPHTYTGEDAAEINLHGSPLGVRRALSILTRFGARPACRGEFTRRAFLAGKLDLVQAEAVIDLIEAATPGAHRDARNALDKEVSGLIHGLSDRIKDILADVEAYIDFDEDEDMPAPEFRESLLAVLDELDRIAGNAEQGLIRREGLKTAVIGKPNVGKSTLFNRLLKTERTIVTPYPGTTRDAVEERLLLGSVSLAITDTAGVRREPEPVEEEGIRRTLGLVSDADLILAVFDASEPLDTEDETVLAQAPDKPMVVVLNKADLSTVVSPADVTSRRAVSHCLTISAHTGEGLVELSTALEAVAINLSGGDTPRTTGGFSRRALSLLEAAAIPLRELNNRATIGDVPEPDIIALELRKALALLEDITGERVDEGVLDRIFERFCVGK